MAEDRMALLEMLRKATEARAEARAEARGRFLHPLLRHLDEAGLGQGAASRLPPPEPGPAPRRRRGAPTARPPTAAVAHGTSPWP